MSIAVTAIQVVVSPTTTEARYDIAIQITPVTPNTSVPQIQPVIPVQSLPSHPPTPESEAHIPISRTRQGGHNRINTTAFGPLKETDRKLWFIVTGVTVPKVYYDMKFDFHALLSG